MDISTADMALLKKRLTGSNLKNLIASNGVSKYRIAKDCGITYRTILNWEKGFSTPSDENAVLVGRYLGLIKKPRKTEILEIKKQQAELQKRLDKLLKEK